MKVVFEISSLPDAQALSRVIGHFAMRTLVPDHMVAERQGEMLKISITQHGIEEQVALLICEKLRSSVLVEAVAISAEPNPAEKVRDD